MKWWHSRNWRGNSSWLQTREPIMWPVVGKAGPEKRKRDDDQIEALLDDQ